MSDIDELHEELEQIDGEIADLKDRISDLEQERENVLDELAELEDDAA